MLRLKSTIILLSILFVVPVARAAKHDAKERAAKRACLNGEPAKGVQILTDLYIDSNDPTYIFNQGRCFEQNNRYEEAIGRFREYLRKIGGTTEADKADTKDAEKHIADCEAVLGRKVGEPGQPTPPPQPQAQTVPPIASTAPPPTIVHPAAPAPPASAGSGLRVAGIVVTAVGGAALVAGIAFNLKANSTTSDLENHFDPNTYSSSKDYRTLSQVGYGAGAVCVVGGLLLYYLGARADDHQVAMLPTLGNGAAGAVLTGAF